MTRRPRGPVREHGALRRRPRRGPILSDDGRFRTVDGILGHFDVDPRVVQDQADGSATFDPGAPEDLSQPGQGDVQGALCVVGATRRPQGLDDLPPRDHAVPVEDKVRERQPPLTSGQGLLDPDAVHLDDDRTTDLDPGRRLQDIDNLHVPCSVHER